MRSLLVLPALVLMVLLAPLSATSGEDGERHVVLVNVLDRGGHPLPGLAAANFRGEYRGKPVRILSAARDVAPRRLAVLLDRSASQLRVGPQVLESVRQLVSALTPQHSLVIGTVNQSVQQRSALTNDRQVLEQALREIEASRPEGFSSLYEAILRACRGLHGTTPGDAVLLLSDCDDTTSAIEAGRIEVEAAKTGVRVFAVLTPGELPPSSTPRNPSWIFSLAEATGGSVTRLDDFPKDLPTVCSMIAEAYRLEVEFPPPVRQGQWKLEVVGADGGRLKARLVYPHRVAPLPPA